VARAAGVQPPVGPCVERVAGRSAALYEPQRRGPGAAAAACRPGMHAARLLLRGDRPPKSHDAVRFRESACGCSLARKARILADACVAATRQSAAAPIADLVEGGFLLDAFVPDPPASAVPEDTRSRAGRAGPGRGPVVWLVDLFERLERRDRAGHPSRQPVVIR